MKRFFDVELFSLFFFLNSFPYIETSAATGYNVEAAVSILLEAVMQRMNKAVESSLLPKNKRKTTLLGEADGRKRSENGQCTC